jgi:Peptidase_C39 like family
MEWPHSLAASGAATKNSALFCVQRPHMAVRLWLLYSRPGMLTDLFTVLSSMPAEVVGNAVPPDVRRPARVAGPVRREGDDVVVDFPVFAPRRPAVHLLPSFCALTTASYSARFEASVPGAGGEAWVATTSIGPADFPDAESGDGPLRSHIDVLVATRPVERVRLRLRLRADDAWAVLGAPWAVTLSTSDGGPVDASETPGRRAIAIDVPAFSQMEEPEPVRRRICSPTSVAMVLALHGKNAAVADLAAEMLHVPLDLYGVWPSAIQAAARRGVAGYLLRFPGWTAAGWCLARGLPIVASVRYEAGELKNAAIPSTPGHLLVLTGLDGDDVLVNDPAAATRADVRRRYRRDELTRVWLDRAGVGYVFFAV